MFGSSDLRLALKLLFSAFVLGVLLAFILVCLITGWTIPLGAQQSRAYNVYKLPYGCLYITTNTGNPAMVYVEDRVSLACDGSRK